MGPFVPTQLDIVYTKGFAKCSAFGSGFFVVWAFLGQAFVENRWVSLPVAVGSPMGPVVGLEKNWPTCQVAKFHMDAEDIKMES